MGITTTGLTKAFAGVRALDNVEINLDDGEIHALLGANGSGKSTLVKVLTGVYQPDHGTIRVGTRRLSAVASPVQANELGVAVVHQEAPLIDTMSVAEGVALFRGYPTRNGRILWDRLNAETEAMLRAHDVRIDPRQLAGKLSPAERALVATVIALDQVRTGLQLLILDEVTASLPEKQAAAFLDHVKTIAEAGTAVLMVTHRLAELQGRADRVTVLRSGRVVHASSADSFDSRAAVQMMIGPAEPDETNNKSSRDGPPGGTGVLSRLWAAAGAPRATDARAPRNGDTVLEARHLSGRFLRDVSFELRSGEIVGMAGLTDGGLGELPQVLGGMIARSGGAIRVDGRELPLRATPRRMIDAGVMLLPVDRLRYGGVASLDLTENVLLPALDRYWRARPQEASVLESVIRDFNVQPPSRKALFGKLSGGNQQKLLLGKWLSMRPRVLVLEDPTSGVDPSARATMFRMMREAAREGVSILFLSTEPEQLASMCSRVLILRDGCIAAELSGEDLDRDVVSQWSYA